MTTTAIAAELAAAKIGEQVAARSLRRTEMRIRRHRLADAINELASRARTSERRYAMAYGDSNEMFNGKHYSHWSRASDRQFHAMNRLVAALRDDIPTEG